MSEQQTKNETAGGQSVLSGFVMREYSQGVAGDGAAILCDGAPMTIEQILSRLRTLEDVRGVIYASPELNHSNYDHDQVCQLDTAMCEAWSIIEADA